MMRKLLFIGSILFFLQPIRATEPDTIFNNQFRTEIGGWIAADATYSIALPDGRTLWLFGDTFIGEVDENNAIIPGSGFIRNSAVIQDGDLLETLFGGSRSKPTDFIPTLNPDSTWYWPEHGLLENDTLRIFVVKFRHDPEGPPGFQFAHAGNDIANFTFPGLQFINSVPLHQPSENGVIYGDRLLEEGAFVYIYGRRNDDPDVNIPYPHAARAPLGSVMDQQWEYFNGSGWAADPMETSRINSFQVSQQYSVTTYRGKFILLTQDIWLSPKIWSFVSDSPVGPWENKKLVYSTPETGGGTFTYNAYAHPQFDRDGELLFSYNVNGDFWSIFSNVELYRPRFMRVPYMNLDYAFWPNGTGPDKLAGPQSLCIFPNPVRDLAVLSLSTEVPGELSSELLDMSGRPVKIYPSVMLGTGTHRLELDVQRIPPGMYLCRVKFNQVPYTLPVLISFNY